MSDNKIKIAHLYGDLMNTYGDWGNILALKYYAKQLGFDVDTTLISLNDDFDENKYDFVLFGGGQDYEETVVATDLQYKKQNIKNFIENNGVFLAICGGFQLLGEYMTMSNGDVVKGASILDHYSVNLNDTLSKTRTGRRLTGNILVEDPETKERYVGFENHQARTFLGPKERPLGTVINGYGNNGTDSGEGVVYRNVFGSYFHGPILTRNGNLAKKILKLILEKKFGKNYEKIKEIDNLKLLNF